MANDRERVCKYLSTLWQHQISNFDFHTLELPTLKLHEDENEKREEWNEMSKVHRSKFNFFLPSFHHSSNIFSQLKHSHLLLSSQSQWIQPPACIQRFHDGFHKKLQINNPWRSLTIDLTSTQLKMSSWNEKIEIVAYKAHLQVLSTT